MKKLIALAFFIGLGGCTATPTISNPTVTQTLTISSNTSPPTNLAGSGTFYDITTNTSTTFIIGNITGTWNFETGKHDTIEFTITFTNPAPISFDYSIGSTQTSTTTSSGSYTSPEISF